MWLRVIRGARSKCIGVQGVDVDSMGLCYTNFSMAWNLTIDSTGTRTKLLKLYRERNDTA